MDFKYPAIKPLYTVHVPVSDIFLVSISSNTCFSHLFLPYFFFTLLNNLFSFLWFSIFSPYVILKLIY